MRRIEVNQPQSQLQLPIRTASNSIVQRQNAPKATNTSSKTTELWEELIFTRLGKPKKSDSTIRRISPQNVKRMSPQNLRRMSPPTPVRVFRKMPADVCSTKQNSMYQLVVNAVIRHVSERKRLKRRYLSQDQILNKNGICKFDWSKISRCRRGSTCMFVHSNQLSESSRDLLASDIDTIFNIYLSTADRCIDIKNLVRDYFLFEA